MVNPYLENGYANRREYLKGLADNFGVDFFTVIALAEALGPILNQWDVIVTNWHPVFSICPICWGDSTCMGALGNSIWYRCSACGLEHQIPADEHNSDDENMEEGEK
jgi:hypothetical protein